MQREPSFFNINNCVGSTDKLVICSPTSDESMQHLLSADFLNSLSADIDVATVRSQFDIALPDAQAAENEQIATREAWKAAAKADLAEEEEAADATAGEAPVSDDALEPAAESQLLTPSTTHPQLLHLQEDPHRRAMLHWRRCSRSWTRKPSRSLVPTPAPRYCSTYTAGVGC